MLGAHGRQAVLEFLNERLIVKEEDVNIQPKLKIKEEPLLVGKTDPASQQTSENSHHNLHEIVFKFLVNY